MQQQEKEERFDGRLAEELNKLAANSLNDHNVEIQIKKVEYLDESAWVKFRPPIGDEFRKEMDIPHSPEEDCEFNDILRVTGHNLFNSEEMIGDYVPAEYAGGEWQLRLPEPPRSRKEKFINKGKDVYESILVLGTLSTWPVSGTLFCIWFFFSEVKDDEPIPEGIFFTVCIWILGQLIWLGIVDIIATILGMPNVIMWDTTITI